MGNGHEISKEKLRPEELDALVTNKLDTLFSENFQRFGIRFVSFQEYRDCLEKGAFKGEVYVPHKENRQPYAHGIPRDYEGLPNVKNFKEYLELAKKFGWINIAEIQTGWTHIVEQINTSKCIVSGIFCRYRGKIKDKLKPYEAKSAVEDLQKMILHSLSDSCSSGLGYRIEDLKQNGASKEMIDAIGQEYADAIVETLRDPQFLMKKENRRKAITALGRLPDAHKNSAYHLALIFDTSALSDKTTWNLPYWYLLKQENKEQCKDLLGAIALSNDRILLGDMQRLSEESGNFAHAVIDSKGRVYYPKSKANNTQ